MVWRGLTLFFCMWLLSCYNLLKSSPFTEKIFFLLNCWESTDYKWTGSFLELSVVLHWFPGLSLVPVLHCFDYCCYLGGGSFERERCWVFSGPFWLFCAPCISIWILESPCQFLCAPTHRYEAARSLIRIIIRSIFGKSCHLDNRPSSPWTWSVFPIIHSFSFFQEGFIGTFNKLISILFLMLLQIELLFLDYC